MRSSIPVAAALTLSLAGCATTGSTFRSGTGDTFLESPPYYAGRIPGAPDPAAGFLVLPVAWQAGAVNPPSFDPGDSPELRGLLEEMDHFLAEAAPGGALGPHTRDGGMAGVAPDVRFGCETGPGMDEGCADTERMVLRVGRPSPEWISWAAVRMEETGAAYALLLTLEVGEYRVRQKNWRGEKEVQLGTGHTVSIPWLTSLETPVSVLQITGALVTPDGRSVRIGAEGILARRTGIVASGLGLQALITDDDVAAATTRRRDDLPGAPLAWQVAVQALLDRLLEVPGSP